MRLRKGSVSPSFPLFFLFCFCNSNSLHSTQNSSTLDWLSSSPSPVLYIALGSIATLTLPQLREFFGGIQKAHEHLGISVLWGLREIQKGREEVEREAEGKKWLRVEKWVDQRSVLMHENVWAFLSHGGQNR